MSTAWNMCARVCRQQKSTLREDSLQNWLAHRTNAEIGAAVTESRTKLW